MPRRRQRRRRSGQEGSGRLGRLRLGRLLLGRLLLWGAGLARAPPPPPQGAFNKVFYHAAWELGESGEKWKGRGEGGTLKGGEVEQDPTLLLVVPAKTLCRWYWRLRSEGLLSYHQWACWRHRHPP